MSGYFPGISVVIPSFVSSSKEITQEEIAGTSLHSALVSLVSQSLKKDLVEVLVVLNGEGVSSVDGDSVFSTLYDTLGTTFPDLNLRVLRSLTPGAGRARNLGISSASRRFITFLDDDDVLQPRFLELGLENTDDETIVLLPIVDTIDGLSTQDNSLNARINLSLIHI